MIFHTHCLLLIFLGTGKITDKQMTDFANVCYDPYKCPMFDHQVNFVYINLFYNLLRCGLLGWRILSVKETILSFIHARRTLSISLKFTRDMELSFRTLISRRLMSNYIHIEVVAAKESVPQSNILANAIHPLLVGSNI